MINKIQLATALSLALTGACAADMGTNDHGLDNGLGLGDPSELCTRTLGDYNEALPPAIDINIGDKPVRAQDAIAPFQSGSNIPADELLAQFAVAQVNIEAGARLSDTDIDILVDAEVALAHEFPQFVGSYGTFNELPTFTATGPNYLPELVAELEDLNSRMSVDVPCIADSVANPVASQERGFRIPPFVPPSELPTARAIFEQSAGVAQSAAGKNPLTHGSASYSQREQLTR